MSRSERVALAMQEIISAEAVDGWEYLRTDTVPVEEKPGFFSRTREVQRAVMIFRREASAVFQARRAVHGVTASPEPELTHLPEGREEREGREPRISLSAERDAPLPPRRNRPPSGLG